MQKKRLKTMTELCESIMDDLDTHKSISTAQIISNSTKITKRSLDEYPYIFMFIMPGKHYLYKDRQKIKNDIISFLEQYHHIKEYSDIIFDKDPGDTTFSFGFEHNIRTVAQFYRMFTGIISYMRKWITNLDYEFIIKDVEENNELCRMNNDDVEFFNNLQMKRHLINTDEGIGTGIGYFQETCVNLLHLSWKTVAEQLSRLFNVQFKFFDGDEDGNHFIIEDVYLNEK